MGLRKFGEGEILGEPRIEPSHGCSEDGCERHPRDGHVILRSSQKGEPFRGQCQEHHQVVVVDHPRPGE